MTPQTALTEARNTGATVTVVLENGIRHTGTVRRSNVPDAMKIQDVTKTWARVFYPDEVVKVIFE